MPDAPLQECWIWVAVDPETQDVDILGVLRGGTHYPLVAVDAETAEYNSDIARAMHSEKPYAPNMHHLHFTNAERLETIE